MKRILSFLFCLCFLTGCGLFYPPRHEVLITQQPYQTNQTSRTEQGSSVEIPLVSTPPVSTNTNTIIVQESSTCYTPSTHIVFGFYPGIYAGFYPRWGYHPFRRHHFWGGHFRRHHFHRPPPPPHRGHGWHRPPPHRGFGGHRPPPHR